MRAHVVMTALSTLLVMGCASYDYAPGYEELTAQETSYEVRPTPGVLFGVTPRSWDLPDGRKVLVEVERAGLTSGFGFYKADLAYELSLGDLVLECATEPSGPSVPETRFGCWSSGQGREVTFWMAPDEECPARNLGFAKTMKTPACWRGVLTTPERSYEVVYSWGSLGGRGTPLGGISWVDVARDVSVQAVYLEQSALMEVYTSPARPDDEADLLLLHALALHIWFDITDMALVTPRVAF